VDIQFSEEQELLRSSVQKLLRDQYDFDTRRKIVARRGLEQETLGHVCRVGLARCASPEASGGLGGGSLATMILMQEFAAIWWLSRS
jgi:alkylation response protein AidB-like acyl-CoA dehydrogenase